MTSCQSHCKTPTNPFDTSYPANVK